MNTLLRFIKNRFALSPLLVIASVVAAHAQQTIPPLPELQFAEIQAKEKFTGDRWSYLEAGPKDAPVIVTLHGIGDNAMQWRYQLSGLSDRFRVIAWNAPGYMLTDGFKNERPDCRDYADALADFLDALKLTRVNLLGNSFGSRVSQCFAMNHPARVNKMVFVGPSASRAGMTAQEKEQYIAGRKEQVAQGGYSFPGKRASALLGAKATPELVELISYAMRATNPRGFMQAAHFLVSEGHSPAEVGAKVTAPLLIINGDEDRITPIAANAEPLHKAIRGARLEILKGIGHLPHVEAPEKVNQMAREFFGDNRTVDASAFIGVWKLISVTALNADGTRNDAHWGVNPKGAIVYTREGWMTAAINYGGRKPLSTADRFKATTEEKAAAYDTSFSYAGRYEIKGDKVIHHVEIASVENWVNTDLIRSFRLQGNRLTVLTPPLATRQGSTAKVELIWERVK